MTRKPEASEHQIQSAFADWCRMSEARYPALKLAFAVPNGSYRHIATAVRAKREGQRAGVPDWILPVPRLDSITERTKVGILSRDSGLAIEFKRPGGRLTKEQKAWISLARIYGWRCEVCYSAEEAIKVVKEYLS